MMSPAKTEAHDSEGMSMHMLMQQMAEFIRGMDEYVNPPDTLEGELTRMWKSFRRCGEMTENADQFVAALRAVIMCLEAESPTAYSDMFLDLMERAARQRRGGANA
jgi:hypothetical protein